MMDRASQRLARRAENALASRLPADAPAVGVRFARGVERTIGHGSAAATLVVKSRRGLAALASMDALRLAEAYREGAIDVEGSLERLLALRHVFSDRHPVTTVWRFVRPRITSQVRSDLKWIADHYEREAAFYLTFLDRRHRCYSQAMFHADTESLEAAQTRKLNAAIEALQVPPGARVLDVGGGWGAFTEHAGQRGLHVTSLTISRASEQFIQTLIDAQRLPCRVVREHLMIHEPAERYDAIVNLGVTEHLPDYPATLRKYAQLLKPGGRIYLDASAARVPHRLSAFFLRYIFPGNGTVVCLHRYLQAVSQSPFELIRVDNDRDNYRLTAMHWAQNLDRHRSEIETRWGMELYRTFRLYLWGCVDGFSRDLIQAYRWVMRLAPSP
jgi:cyclopropane-fatty-acyl-phospholipid synthase